jgi:hypothetical protein
MGAGQLPRNGITRITLVNRLGNTMIVADKEALATQLKRSSLIIQEKEINFFTSNFNSLATQSALLAGFAFSALSSIDTKDDHTLLAFFFYASTAISMCLNLLVVISCTFCNMWGPGMALRGPDGSMAKAVSGMDAERQEIFLFFGLGLWFLMLGLIAVAWCKAFWHNAVLVTFIAVVFMQLFLRYTRRIWNRFSLENTEVVSGTLVLGGVDAGTFEIGRVSNRREQAQAQQAQSENSTRVRRTSALGDAPFRNLAGGGSSDFYPQELPRPTHRSSAHPSNPLNKQQASAPKPKQKRWSWPKAHLNSSMGVSNQPPLSQVDQSATFSREHTGHAAL